jgi:hypothetical protein
MKPRHSAAAAAVDKIPSFLDIEFPPERIALLLRRSRFAQNLWRFAEADFHARSVHAVASLLTQNSSAMSTDK